VEKTLSSSKEKGIMKMKTQQVFAVLLSALCLTVLVSCNANSNAGETTGAITTDSNVDETTGAITTESTVIETPASEFEYSENEDGTITIKKYEGSATDVVIPQAIDNKPVTRIDNGCFWNRRSLISVTLPESVKEIGAAAFEECRSLEAVTLPSSLKIIENQAFENCFMLSDISLPEGLTEIHGDAFAYCSNLKSVRIPSSVTTWMSSAFFSSGLTSVQIENGVTYIPDAAFAHTNISELILPSSVETIGRHAFYNCQELRSVSLNEGLVTIGSASFGAFKACTKLTEIVIPHTVTTINDFVFEGCESLEKVYFEGNAPENFIYGYISPSRVTYTICYHENATGFTAPEWNGYPTQIW
jgi:hypothetical protein